MMTRRHLILGTVGLAVTCTAACGPAAAPSAGAITSIPSASGLASPAPPAYAWTQLHPATSPLARNSAGTGFDEATKTMVISGGQHGCAASATFYSDTWNWDGSNWVQLHPVNHGPAELTIGSPEAYDPQTKTLVLLSGPPSCGMGTITWQWNGSDWSSKSNDSPMPPPGGTIAFDAASQQLLLWNSQPAWEFSAATQPTGPSTWVYSGGTWRQLHPATEPPGTLNAVSMVYDAATQQLLMYDSDARSGWRWDGTNWAPLPGGGPSSRIGAGMVYDADLGKVVLFGGEAVTGHTPGASPGDTPTIVTGAALGDTWTWTGTTWTQLTLAGGPTPRFNGQIAYDDVHHQIVLFGGSFSDSADGDDTWVFAPTK